MAFRARVPWFITRIVLGLVDANFWYPTDADPTERAFREQFSEHLKTLVAGCRQGFYDERTLYTIIILATLHDVHRLFLDAGAHHGVRYLSIGPEDLVVIGGARWGMDPLAWRIAELSGLYAGVGNGSQAQLHDVFGEYTECFGIWDCRTGERMADALVVEEMDEEEVERPIPEGTSPDFEKMRVR